MSHAEWSTAATFLHKREMCKTLQLDTIISYLKHHGKDKCAEYDVPFLSAPTALRGASRNVAQYEAYELAVAMGLDDAGAYPARETLSAAAQRAAENRTVSTRAPSVRHLTLHPSCHPCTMTTCPNAVITAWVRA